MTKPRDALRGVERLLTLVAALACGAVLLGSLLAADPPAAPCAAEQLDKAKADLKEATDKLAELDKDPRKPAAGSKFTKDYENDKASADSDVKLAKQAVADSQKAVDSDKKRLQEMENAKGAKYTGQTGAQIRDAKDKLAKEKSEASQKLAKAMFARQAFGADPTIVNHSKALGTEKDDLVKKMSQYMDPAQSDPILDSLNDPEARAKSQKLLDDDSYVHLEFTGLTPDGDVRGHGESLLDRYGTFRDRQTGELRRRLDQAVKDARDGKAGAVDQIRQLGPELIADITRCRGPVQASFAKVTTRQDAIKKRMEDLDPEGAELVKQIPALNESVKKLDAEAAALDAQLELAGPAKDLATDQKTLETNQQALEDAKKAAKAADTALTNYKAWDGVVGPWYTKQKTAEGEVDRLQKIVEADTKKKDQALSKARTDYAANETDLSDFKAHMQVEKAEIDKLRADPKADKTALNARIKAAVKTVKDKRESAIKLLQGIKATLDPFRHCFKDADEYVTSVLNPKIHSLGGTNETAAGVSDMDDPLAGLLDIPVDKPGKTEQPGAEEWIRSKPIFASNNTDGRMPPGLLSPSATSLGYKAERDGKTWSSTLTWSEPPEKLHKGDTVTLKMDASGERGWANVGGWFNFKCAERDSVKGDNGAGTDTNWRAKSPHSGTLTFKFDPSNGNPYIQVSAGHDPNPNEWMLVTWKYEKKAK